MMHEGDDASREDSSVYAARGVDRDRVKKALSEPCCKGKCKRRLTIGFIMKVVVLFWSLPKASQDCLLWSMQQNMSSKPDGDEDTHSESSGHDRDQFQVSWFFEGLPVHMVHSSDVECLPVPALLNVFPSPCQSPASPVPGIPVCRQAFIKILGISASRLVRTRKTFKGFDQRKLSFLAIIWALLISSVHQAQAP